MHVLQREKLIYIKNNLPYTWFAYILLVGFFMLALDAVRGSSRPLLFYISVIAGIAFVMALFELFFYRKVIKVSAEKLPEMLQVIKALSFEKAESQDNQRQYYIMQGRRYFLRSLDMTILTQDAFLYLNLNIFHLRYFRRFMEA